MNLKKLSAAFLCLIFCIAALTGCNTSQTTGMSERGSVPSSETSSDQSSSEESSNDSDSSDSSNNSGPLSEAASSNSNPSSNSNHSSNSAPSGSQSSPPTQSSAPSASTPSKPGREPQPSHQHRYSSQVIAPTCTQNGYTVHTCSCGDKYTDSNTNALGHSWGDWKVLSQPTTAYEGQKQRSCSRCGSSESASIPKLELNSSGFAAEVIRLVNAERANNGLPPLSEVSDLSSYAQLRSTEIVSNFAHERPDDSNPLNYVMQMGKYFTAGENIAYGQSSPEAVMNSWMNSPGHRANILNENFSYIGVGCYHSNGRLYWVQIFAG